MRILTANRRIAELESENERLVKENAHLRADSDYIAMMTNVDLEEDENEQEV